LREEGGSRSIPLLPPSPNLPRFFFHFCIGKSAARERTTHRFPMSLTRKGLASSRHWCPLPQTILPLPTTAKPKRCCKNLKNHSWLPSAMEILLLMGGIRSFKIWCPEPRDGLTPSYEVAAIFSGRSQRGIGPGNCRVYGRDDSINGTARLKLFCFLVPPEPLKGKRVESGYRTPSGNPSVKGGKLLRIQVRREYQEVPWPADSGATLGTIRR
jgi:hypothetical protein